MPENFEEYNPHPYQGGYDIALTYGDPLPASPAICHPLPGPAETPIPPPAGREDYGSSYRLGEPGFAPADWWWNLGGCGGADAEEMRYWGRLRRAGDYIFGCSQGFGERRVGVDGDGIPIYACESRGGGAVGLQVEDARTEKLECWDGSERVRFVYFVNE